MIETGMILGQDRTKPDICGYIDQGLEAGMFIIYKGNLNPAHDAAAVVVDGRRWTVLLLTNRMIIFILPFLPFLPFLVMILAYLGETGK